MNRVLLSSKITIILLLLLLGFFSYSKYTQIKNQNAINKEKQDLINQANSLSKENVSLSQSISYLNSPDFKEKVAREQLDLKRNGESAYNFTQVTPTPTPTPELTKSLPNPQKWWAYFSGQN